MSVIDEAKEPLLLDEFGGKNEVLERRWRFQCPQLPRTTLRGIVILLVGALFFVGGLLAHGGNPLHRRLSEDLALSIRVRVLNSLLQERYPATDSQRSRHENYDALDRLATCLESGTCGPGERKVILLASYHFGLSEDGGTGGEDVWARSTMTSFRALNYTMLMTWGHMDALFIYQSIPELIPVVLWEEGEFVHCAARNATNYSELENLENNAKGSWQTGKKACMQTEDYPQGIPWWKSFLFLFWDSDPNPLGQRWTVSPEDYDHMSISLKNHTYLGYSIERKCHAIPFHTRREHRALILAKDARYFVDNAFAGHLKEAARTLPHEATRHGDKEFELLCTAGDKAGEEMPEPGITSIGRQDQADWSDMLAMSKVLLGIGMPRISPSPHYALCLGVPFINPILHWDKADPDNRMHWNTQTDALKYLDEPYVYHVHQGDIPGLKAALHRAAATPIKRYIVPKMRRPAVTERHRRFIEHDWLSEAKAVIAEKGDPSLAYLAMDPPDLDTSRPPH